MNLKTDFPYFCYCYGTLSQHFLNLLIHQLCLFVWHHYGSWRFCLFPDIIGSMVSFFQFLREYFNLLALGRLGISARNKVTTSGWMWLNSAGNRSSGVLSNSVSGKNMSSWQSCWLTSLCERTSPPVSSGSKQGDSLKGLRFGIFRGTRWWLLLVQCTKKVFRFCHDFLFELRHKQCFLLDFSLKVSAFSFIIDSPFFLSYTKDNIKSYVRTCVHGLPQKKSSIGWSKEWEMNVKGKAYPRFSSLSSNPMTLLVSIGSTYMAQGPINIRIPLLEVGTWPGLKEYVFLVRA